MQHFARLAIVSATALWSMIGELQSCCVVQNPTAARADDEIEKLRRALLDAESETRERAVVALLGRPELEAHRVLQEALLRGADAAGVSDRILMHLGIALSNTSHPVFADAKLRPVLIRDYGPVLVRYFGTSSAPPGAATLQDRALRALRSLTYLERKAVLEEIVRGVDRDLAVAAVRAAGKCRDVSTLAPWLFELSADGELGPAARAALAELTFVDGGFADRPAFDAWFAEHGQRQFVDLAEEAARRAAAAAGAARAESDAAFVQQTARLVAALARTESPDWIAIRAEVLAPEPAGRTVACLRALRDAIEPRASGGVRPGGVVQDRQAFVDALLARVANQPSPEAYPVLLETIAYLTVLDDTAQRAAVEVELLRALRAGDHASRLAALRGLRRFPSAAHREAVVEVALTALAEKEHETLTAALQCLRDGAWRAPEPTDPDEENWLILLRRVMTETGLELRQRELALGIATLQEGDESLVARVFDLLVEIARSPERELAFRKQVLPRLWQFTRDEHRAEEYVRRVVELLGDPEADMRALAAGQLEILPEASQAKVAEWNRRIVMRASDRLLIEPERKVLSGLVDLLLRVAEDPASGEEVVGRLKNAALAMAENPRPEDSVRREVVIEALRVIGVGRDRQPTIWVAAGQGLAELGARGPLRQILERQQIENLSDVSAPGVAEAFELLIAAARLAPDDVGWDQRLDEAREVEHAFSLLEKAERAPDSSADRVLRLEVLSALGQHDEVVRRGEVALAAGNGSPLTDSDRAAVLLAMARAHVALGQLDAATARLERLDDLGEGDTPAALDIWTKLAAERIEVGAPALAADIVQRVLARTPQDSPSWRERFLLHVEARLDADDAAQREAILEDLRSHEGRFQGGDVPPELQARYTELRGRAEAGRTVSPGR